MLMIAFIHSVYCSSVLTSFSGEACAEKLAVGAQYWLQPAQPLPVSQASKNSSAILVIFAIGYFLLTHGFYPGILRISSCTRSLTGSKSSRGTFSRCSEVFPCRCEFPACIFRRPERSESDLI